jgi:hypothetical protein
MKNNVLMRELGLYAALIINLTSRLLLLAKRFGKYFITLKSNFFLGMEKRQKRVFIYCNIFLSAYITFVFYISNSKILFTGLERTILVFVNSIFVFFIIYNALLFFCSKCDFTTITAADVKKPLRKETVLLFSFVCFLFLFLSLAASYPGAYSPDTRDQWKQVHTFEFNDWHPVIHTLLIWLVTRIVDSYAFVIFIQISVFSMGVGFLIAALESWGFGRGNLLLAGLFIILNPYTMSIMMFPWKDLTLTILITYTAVMMINIYYSKGEWFSKTGNIISFALTTGLASMVRHNGIFFTVPLNSRSLTII